MTNSKPNDWDQWLEEIQSKGTNLTVWEEEFVESIQAQRDLGRMLSSEQARILERIYADRTP